MNPAPGTSWPDLHYVDTEQVELDVFAIIARGTRLRRRRLMTKIVAAAIVIGVGPAAVIADMTRGAVINGPAAVSKTPHRVPRTEYQVTVHASTHVKAPAGFSGVRGPEAGMVVAAPNDVSFAGDDLTFSLARAGVRRAATLSRKYGPLLSIAGARASSGIWFTATAAELTLFRLSMTGALRSWPLPAPASSVRASAGVGLAVTSAGLAWLGVGSTLVSLNTRTSQASTWRVPMATASETSDPGANNPGASDRGASDQGNSGHVVRQANRPGWPGYSLADSVAVSPDGHVAVAMSRSSSVQVLDPRNGTFRPIRLPDAADQPLVVGYARNGTLGIGYWRPGRPDTGAVLLVSPAGTKLSASVAQPTAVSAYGMSGLLVGVTKLVVVSARGRRRPLLLPADSPGGTSVSIPPAPLPAGRLGIALDTAILTFPAAATSTTIATNQSELWVTQSPRCRPRHGCPAGYTFMATDADGNLWVVPKANPRTVELVSLG